MKVSSSIARPVAIAASTIVLIEAGWCGMFGRKRHSYSWSSPVDSSTIGWKCDFVGADREEQVEHLRLDAWTVWLIPIRSAMPDSWTAAVSACRYFSDSGRLGSTATRP